jgi:hypothetical protein
MIKTKYEQARDENVRKIQEHFLSLGIPILAQDVRDAFSKKQKGKGKTVESDKTESDIDYDPSSDIDNQAGSDGVSDDDLINEVNTKVRSITCPIDKFMVCLFETCTSLKSINLLHTSFLINKMHVPLAK